MQRRGLRPQADPDEETPRHDEPLLAELSSAWFSGRIAGGPRARSCVARVRAVVDVDDAALPPGRCCAAFLGHDVHAGVCVPARDRMRLARYAGRPPPASERSSLLPYGRLFYRLKHRWRDATTHVIYEPLELMEPLSAMVPPLLHRHQAETSKANRRRRGCSDGAHQSRNENGRLVPGRAARPTNFESREGVTRKDLRPQSTPKRNNLLDKNFRSGLEESICFSNAAALLGDTVGGTNRPSGSLAVVGPKREFNTANSKEGIMRSRFLLMAWLCLVALIAFTAGGKIAAVSASSACPDIWPDGC